MFKTNRRYHSFPLNTLLVLSLFGVTCLPSCGPAENPTLSTATNEELKNNDKTVKSETTNQPVHLAQSLEGTWTRGCVPNESPSAETLSFKNEKFTREFVVYKNNCIDEVERYQVSGTYELGSAATNIRELTFETGNFSLKPVTIKGARNIDFTINEWVFNLKRPIENQDRIELEALAAKCPDVQIEENSSTLKVRRNGCQNLQLKGQQFDIISLQGNQVRLGMYINDVNSFDPAGGTTPERRNNVFSSTPLSRVK